MAKRSLKERHNRRETNFYNQKLFTTKITNNNHHLKAETEKKKKKNKTMHTTKFSQKLQNTQNNIGQYNVKMII